MKTILLISLLLSLNTFAGREGNGGSDTPIQTCLSKRYCFQLSIEEVLYRCETLHFDELLDLAVINNKLTYVNLNTCKIIRD